MNTKNKKYSSTIEDDDNDSSGIGGFESGGSNVKSVLGLNLGNSNDGGGSWNVGGCGGVGRGRGRGDGDAFNFGDSNIGASNIVGSRNNVESEAVESSIDCSAGSYASSVNAFIRLNLEIFKFCGVKYNVLSSRTGSFDDGNDVNVKGGFNVTDPILVFNSSDDDENLDGA